MKNPVTRVTVALIAFALLLVAGVGFNLNQLRHISFAHRPAIAETASDVGAAMAYTTGEALFVSQDNKQLQSHDLAITFGINAARDWQFGGLGNGGTTVLGGRVNAAAGEVDNRVVLPLPSPSPQYVCTGYEGILAVTDTSVARAIYLPDASKVPAGYKVEAVDESGAANSNNIWIYGNTNAQTINGTGGNTGVAAITTAYGHYSVYNSGGATPVWFTK